MYFDNDTERTDFYAANCTRCRWQHINAGLTMPACSVWQSIDYEYHAFIAPKYTGVASLCADFTAKAQRCPFFVGNGHTSDSTPLTLFNYDDTSTAME